MKLAAEVPEKYEEFLRFSRKPQEAHMNPFLCWNLRPSLNEEMMPAEILKCMKLVKSEFGDDPKYLPRLVRFMRYETKIYLEQNLQPVMLRDVIGDRTRMLSIGP